MGRNYAQINFENSDLATLKAARAASSGVKEANRFSALIMLYNGYERTEVCKHCDIAASTLREWVRWFNESGIDGLLYSQEKGRKTKILNTPIQERVDEYLDKSINDNSFRFTGRKFHGYLTDELKMQISYSTAIRYLHNKDLTRLYPRRIPHGGNDFDRTIFIREINRILKQKLSKLWFLDEVGFEANSQRARVWCPKGKRPGVFYNGDHIRESIIGAVNPDSGEFFSLMMPHVDVEVFQIYLDKFAETTLKEHEDGNKIILVMDNASWHKSPKLEWHHIQPMYLPPYSPDLNPIERLWAVIKDEFFVKFGTRKREVLLDRIQNAVQSLLKNPETVRSVCNVDCFR